MKKITLILVVLVLTYSCKKEVDTCKCGEIIDMYSYNIGSNPNTQIHLGNYYVVKNNCSGKTKEFKTTAEGYDIGQEYCAKSKW